MQTRNLVPEACVLQVTMLYNALATSPQLQPASATCMHKMTLPTALSPAKFLAFIWLLDNCSCLSFCNQRCNLLL